MLNWQRLYTLGPSITGWKAKWHLTKIQRQTPFVETEIFIVVAFLELYLKLMSILTLSSPCMTEGNPWHPPPLRKHTPHCLVQKLHPVLLQDPNPLLPDNPILLVLYLLALVAGKLVLNILHQVPTIMANS